MIFDIILVILAGVIIAFSGGQNTPPQTAQDIGQNVNAAADSSDPAQDSSDPAVAVPQPAGSGDTYTVNTSDTANYSAAELSNASDQTTADLNTANPAAPPAPAELPGNKAVHTLEDFAADGVNELKSIPILMYHGIFEMTDAETGNLGGNVDPAGATRTSESFIRDLENYYQWGYRMVRLQDVLEGNIDVEYGYSPVVLTFDDGLNQAEIEGFDESGYPVFKHRSALAILEEMKQKYPDFQVTATFFVNCPLFGNEYEEDVQLMNWMVDNGYDIGNHTWNHLVLSDCSEEEIEAETGKLYYTLEEIIPGRYVNIIALPYGDPGYITEEEKYGKILHGYYNGMEFHTDASLLAGWSYQEPPFHTAWDPLFIKRFLGYDNNGEYDIEMFFRELNEGARYISDGDPGTIVIPKDSLELLGNTFGKELITY